MKKITILLCMSLLFCFTDCKRKPDNSVDPQKSALTDQQEDNIEQEDALASYHDLMQELMPEFFRDKHHRKKILFSKNMGGKKHRDFYIMETWDGAALVVHDNWNGNVRSLDFDNWEKGKDFQPKEGDHRDISGFPSPDGKYFFAVLANYRNGRQSWPGEYDIYRINTTTLEARYITACGSCYKNKNGFTVITGKEDPNSKWGENLDRYETYDFSGRMVSKTKYIPEIKLLDNFYKGNDKKEKTNLPSIKRHVRFL